MLLWLALLVAHAGAPPAEDDALAAARAHRAARSAEIVGELAELLRLPNTALDVEGLEQNAEALRSKLSARGITAEVWRIGAAPPLVYGRLEVSGARRTLGLYAHYDGQPVEPEHWTDPPFAPTLRTAAIEAGGVVRPLPRTGEPVEPEWRLYARSAGDDKAAIVAMLAALDALRAHGLAPTSNLVFLFDGEEEAGSPHLAAYLERERAKLRVDAWLFCDGPVHASRRAQLAFGVRGVAVLDLTVYGAVRPLHSGHYGNWAPNPAQLLAGLLASMKDADGRVLVEGFYDSTRPPTAAELAALERLPDHDAELRRELGLAATEAGGAALGKRLMLPGLNVRGMSSGAVGERASNVIPTTAEASLDLRLVPGNDPEAMLDLVERHVRAQGFHVVREEPDAATRAAHSRIVMVRRRGGYPAVRTSMEHPRAREVAAAADAAAGGAVVLLPTLGGSLPLHLFAEVPVVVVPIANHDDNQHAADENLRLGNLEYGVDLFAALFGMP